MKGACLLTMALALVAGCVGTTQPSQTISEATPIPPGKARITIVRNASALGPKWQVIDQSGTVNPSEVSVICYLHDYGLVIPSEQVPASTEVYVHTDKAVFPAPVYEALGLYRGPIVPPAGRRVVDLSLIIVRYNDPNQPGAGATQDSSALVPKARFESLSLVTFPRLDVHRLAGSDLIPKADFERRIPVFRGLNVGILGRGGQVTYDRKPGQVDLLMFNERLEIPHHFRSLKVEAGRWYFLRAQNRGSQIDDLQLERVQ